VFDQLFQNRLDRLIMPAVHSLSPRVCRNSMECRRWPTGAGACPGTSLPITTRSNFQTPRYTTGSSSGARILSGETQFAVTPVMARTFASLRVRLLIAEFGAVYSATAREVDWPAILPMLTMHHQLAHAALQTSAASMQIQSDSLDDRGVGHPPCFTHCLETIAATGLLEGIEHRRHEPGTRGTERMTECDSATAWVQLAGIDL